MRPEEYPFAVAVKLLGAHIQVIILNGEDIRKAYRHLQGLQLILQILASFRVTVIENDLGKFFT